MSPLIDMSKRATNTRKQNESLSLSLSITLTLLCIYFFCLSVSRLGAKKVHSTDPDNLNLLHLDACIISICLGSCCLSMTLTDHGT